MSRGIVRLFLAAGLGGSSIAAGHVAAGELCAPAPRTGCFEAVDASLRLPARNRLIWKWKKGEPVPIEALGDPTTRTSFALCIYDDDAASGANGLLASLEAPAGPPWRAKSRGAGFRFAVSAGGAAALPTSGPFSGSSFYEELAAVSWNALLGLKGGRVPRTKLRMSVAVHDGARGALKVKARGRRLGLGAVADTARPFAQLQASDGTCFGGPEAMPRDGGAPLVAGEGAFDAPRGGLGLREGPARSTPGGEVNS